MGHQHHWIIFDSHCQFCQNMVRRLRGWLKNKPFRFVPYETEWVKARLKLPDDQFNEMIVLTQDDQTIGAGAAVVFIAKHIWWVRPLYWIAKLPGMMNAIEKIYRWIARNRYCISGQCQIDFNSDKTH